MEIRIWVSVVILLCGCLVPAQGNMANKEKIRNERAVSNGAPVLMKSHAVTRIEKSSSAAAHHRAKRSLDASTLSDTEKQALLDSHNDERADKGASDMWKLGWDDDLAAMAQTYANECEWGHGQPTLETGDTYYGESLGQNLAASSATTYDVTSGVTNWIAEKADYNYNANSCSATCGHYTQVVWADTKKVGCAKKDCDPIDGLPWDRGFVLVCNYYPPGNYQGEKPYTQGSSCSATSCSDRQCCEDDLCVATCGDTDVTDDGGDNGDTGDGDGDGDTDNGDTTGDTGDGDNDGDDTDNGDNTGDGDDTDNGDNTGDGDDTDNGDNAGDTGDTDDGNDTDNGGTDDGDDTDNDEGDGDDTDNDDGDGDDGDDTDNGDGDDTGDGGDGDNDDDNADDGGADSDETTTVTTTTTTTTSTTTAPDTCTNCNHGSVTTTITGSCECDCDEGYEGDTCDQDAEETTLSVDVSINGDVTSDPAVWATLWPTLQELIAGAVNGLCSGQPTSCCPGVSFQSTNTEGQYIFTYDLGQGVTSAAGFPQQDQQQTLLRVYVTAAEDLDTFICDAPGTGNRRRRKRAVSGTALSQDVLVQAINNDLTSISDALEDCCDVSVASVEAAQPQGADTSFSTTTDDTSTITVILAVLAILVAVSIIFVICYVFLSRNSGGGRRVRHHKHPHDNRGYEKEYPVPSFVTSPSAYSTYPVGATLSNPYTYPVSKPMSAYPYRP